MSWKNTENKYSKEECATILKICAQYDYNHTDAKLALLRALPGRPEGGLLTKAKNLVKKHLEAQEDQQEKDDKFGRVLFYAYMSEFSLEELADLFQLPKPWDKILPHYKAALAKYNVENLTREQYAKFKALDT